MRGVGLGDPAESQPHGAAAERMMRTDHFGHALLMGARAACFEQGGGGVLAGVDRPWTKQDGS